MAYNGAKSMSAESMTRGVHPIRTAGLHTHGRVTQAVMGSPGHLALTSSRCKLVLNQWPGTIKSEQRALEEDFGSLRAPALLTPPCNTRRAPCARGGWGWALCVLGLGGYDTCQLGIPAPHTLKEPKHPVGSQRQSPRSWGCTYHYNDATKQTVPT